VCGTADSHVETSEGVQEVDKRPCQRENFVCFPSSGTKKSALTRIARDNRKVMGIDHSGRENGIDGKALGPKAKSIPYKALLYTYGRRPHHIMVITLVPISPANRCLASGEARLVFKMEYFTKVRN
jgi:hypothetical protein